MSRLRANQITNENANGAPNFPHGLTVTGIVTATNTQTTFSNIVVGSAVTANSNGVDTVGIVTAGTLKDKAGGTFAPNPTTTQGDVIVRGASANERLAIGSAGQVLKVNSSANGLEYGGGGKTLQSKYARTNSVISSNNNYNNKNYGNNYGSTNGTQILNITITPQSSTSHFQIWYSGDHACGGNAHASSAIFHGSTRVTTTCTNNYAGDAGGMHMSAWIDTSSLSGSQQITVRNMGSQNGSTQFVNSDHSGNSKNTYCYLQVHEIED